MNQSPEQEKSPYKVLIAIVVFLVLLGLYLLIAGGPSERNGEVNYSQVNLLEAEAPHERIPEGFSVDIPVEYENITESYMVEGEELTQYTVEYISSDTVEEKRQEYETYIEESAFSLEVSEGDEDLASVRGTTAQEDLIVLITHDAGITKVNLTYVQIAE